MKKINFSLIPRAAYGQKLKSVTGEREWLSISTKIREKADYVCSCCGERHPEPYGTHAHEIWEFNQRTKTQKLKDIVCVCANCHEVIHFLNSKLPQATLVDRYITINDMSKEEGLRDYKVALRRFLFLTDTVDKWELDVSEYKSEFFDYKKYSQPIIAF